MRRFDRYRDEFVIAAAALAVRAFYMSAHAKTPYFNQPILDSLWIHQWASALADGTWRSHDAFFRAPLYPWFVSGLYRLFGPAPWVVEVLQHLLGIVTILVVYRLSRRLFGRAEARVAAGALILYRLGPFFEGELLIVTLAATLGIAFVALFTLAADRAAGRGRMLALGGAGVTLGLACAARPNFLILLPLAVLWLGARVGWRHSVGVCAALLLGAVLPIGPIVVRNLVVSGQWVPIATQGGLNFYVGNGPEADGRTARAPGSVEPLPTDESTRAYRDNITLAGQAIAESAVGRRMSGADVSRYWLRRTAAHIRDDPGAWAKLMFHKTYYLLNNFEISDNRSLREVPFPAVCVLGFGWLAALGAAGVFQILRHFRNSSIIVYLTFLYCFSIVLFFVNARMRFTIVPLIAVLAGAGAIALLETLPAKRALGVFGIAQNRRGRTNGLILWSLFGIVAVVSHTRFYGVDSESAQAAYAVNRGYLLLEQGDCTGALGAYEEAVAAAPNMLEAAYGQARALERCGRLEAAAARFRAATRQWPGFVHAYLGLARVSAAQGDSGTAGFVYSQAVRVSPDDPAVLAAWAGYLLRAGRFEPAAAAYERLLVRQPQELKAWLNYGYTLSALGRRSEAISAWEKVVNLSTDPSVTAMARRNIDEARRGLEE